MGIGASFDKYNLSCQYKILPKLANFNKHVILDA